MNISATDLRRAAEIKEKIESLESELAGILGGNERGNGNRPMNGRSIGGKKGRRKMSAAAKAKIAAAQRARWAKWKAAHK